MPHTDGGETSRIFLLDHGHQARKIKLFTIYNSKFTTQVLPEGYSVKINFTDKIIVYQTLNGEVSGYKSMSPSYIRIIKTLFQHINFLSDLKRKNRT